MREGGKLKDATKNDGLIIESRVDFRGFTLSNASPVSHTPNTFCSSGAAVLWGGN